MIIKIKKKDKGFTQISNDLLTDNRLSLRSRGLMAMLLSKPESWEVSIQGLIVECKEGREAIRACFKELSANGYAELETYKKDNGDFAGKRWVIHEEPITERRVSGPSENRTVRKAVGEIVTLNKINIKHTPDFQEKSGSFDLQFDNTETQIQASELPKLKANYPADFLELWAKYAHKAGSKKKAAEKWSKLTEAEKAEVMQSLPVYIAETCTVDIPGAIWKRRRKDLEFYLSGRCWESYIDKADEVNGKDFVTPHEEKYQEYLRYMAPRFPNVFANARHLSKKQFHEYKEGKYIAKLHMINTQLQLTEFLRSHEADDNNQNACAKFPNVWEYHKAKLQTMLTNGGL